MCIKRRTPSPEPLPIPMAPPPPYFRVVPQPMNDYPLARHISDPLYMFPFYYPWPPTNPPWPPIPPLPMPQPENITIPTPLRERTTRRPNLYSLQEFLHEEEHDQQTHDPQRTLRATHTSTL